MIAFSGWIRQAWMAETFRATWPAFVLSRPWFSRWATWRLSTSGLIPLRLARRGEPAAPHARTLGRRVVFADCAGRVSAAFNPRRRSQIAFFPALPLLTRAALLLDLTWMPAAVVIVTAAFFWGLTYVYRLGARDAHRRPGRASILLLLCFIRSPSPTVRSSRNRCSCLPLRVPSITSAGPSW